MKRIAELRKSKHLNQTGLAMQLNVSQKMISAYENGLHQPSIGVLKKMSQIFGVSVDYLIENTDIKTPANAFSKDVLQSDEIEILSLFKDLNKTDRQRAIGILFALKNYNSEI